MPLPGTGMTYTSNTYLIMGDWKRLNDPNTLIDVGSDPHILEALEQINTGLGKKKIDQIILTHGHSDHMANLSLIRKLYDPIVYGFSPYVVGVDKIVKHGDLLRMGDREFEVLHTPGHSEDSISLYNREEGVLFVGDFPLIIRTKGGTYTKDYLQALRMLSERDIRIVYFGHGQPMHHKIGASLRHTLEIAESYFAQPSLP